MTFRTLIRRSLRFHWRAHLGVVLGAAIGSAALIGALVVGDSVKGSLRKRALERLGPVTMALDAGDRLFPADLAKRILQWERLHAPPANQNTQYTGLVMPVAKLNATVVTSDGSARARNVNLYVTSADAVSKIAGKETDYGKYPNPNSKMLLVNPNLATLLHVVPGDEILLRYRKPELFSADSAIAPRNEATVAHRLRVSEVITAGNFSLRSTPLPPLNSYTTWDTLGDSHLTNRANLLLAAWYGFERGQLASSLWRFVPGWLWDFFPSLSQIYQPRFRPMVVQHFQTALGDVWQLTDLQTRFVAANDDRSIELRTERVFLDPPVVRVALTADTNAQPVLTYLVNLLSAGTNATPYSMVTAAGAPWTLADMRDDEVIVSKWLAEDLRVKPGDEIAMSYFLPESGARLEEGTNLFRVRAIVPMEMPWADRTLMPDFPGIEKAESTSDWDAGFPLVHKIRDQDEDYWKKHRGTPKAYITLAAGQKMWANRFGDLTAIRFPIPTNTPPLTPALSPGERENRSPATQQPSAPDSSAAKGKSGDARLLSPFPGGEGQGEGGRQTNSVGTSSTPSQTPAKDGDAVERVPTSVDAYRAALEKKILANLKPEELGLRFEPVREQALKAAEQSQDFGGLFLGFSFFLIVAALLLMAMLFQFGLEQRTTEIGTLLALGFTPRQVRRLLLGEGVALAFLGGVLGALGGLAYAKAMLHGLATIWRDAVGASALNFHATPQTLAIGLFAATVVSVITIWLALRKFVRRSARELLVGEFQSPESGVRSRGRLIGGVALAGAFGLVGYSLVRGDTANAAAFFGAGALVLIAGLSFVSAWLARLVGSPLTPSVFMSRPLTLPSPPMGERVSATTASFTLSSLAMGGCARRRTRSLATIAMLACGSFLIVSIGVFRLDANRDATKRSSGTGGFAMIGETTMPVVNDLNSESGRDFFALSERDLEGVSFVPFRVREGDEASCLNLNRAQKPRLLGVKPNHLENRFTFAKGDDWKSLINTRLQPGESDAADSENRLSGLPASRPDNTGLKPGVNEIEIPAIGDANSIQWSMGKKVGETIDFVDERGQPFKVRIVGAVANSILQGQLIIDEAEFVRRFPGESGHRMFLIDAPSNRVAEVSATLSRAMQDVGLELTPTAQRLAQFNAVQNTYLGTFQVLGGLGLLLGSVGLGIVVLRNVLERRGELAVLLAVGFRKPTLQRLLLIENGALLALGLALGVAAATVAVLPAVLSPAAQLPYASLLLTLGAVLVNGALWTWAATRFALRGNLLAALRND